jgi:uncharacterized membrane protein YdbT with pleckstrin-like domain
MFKDYFTRSLKENEHLVEVLHRHWATFVFMLGEIVIVALLPLFALSFILSSVYATVVYLVFLCILLFFGIYKWLVWYFDVFIITDMRVIDIEQVGLFHRTVHEAAMSRIQDVTYSVDGFFSTLWNYGTVTVRTASEEALSLRKVPDPEGVHEAIVELQKLAHSDTAMSAEDLVAYIAKLKQGDHERSMAQGKTEDQNTSEIPGKRKRQV